MQWNYPQSDINAFAAKLNGLGSEGEKIVLFPTQDLEVTLLAELSTILPDRFLYYRNSAEKVNALSDKNLVDETARKAGLDLPKTCLLSGPINPLDLGFHFPIIIKPLGQSASQTPFKNYFAADLAEFQNLLKTYEGLYNHTIVQEFIPGGDDHVYECILMVNDQAQTIGAVEFQKIRQYLPMRGMTSFGRTLQTRDMVPLCERLTRSVGYTGLIDVEFKKDDETGRWIFLEANLRLPIFNSAFPASGANLAYLYVTSLLGKISPPVFATCTATWMHEENDLSNVFTRKVETPFREWLGQFLKSDSYAFWNSKDPLPGLYSFGHIFLLSLRKVFYALSLITGWSKLFRLR